MNSSPLPVIRFKSQQCPDYGNDDPRYRLGPAVAQNPIDLMMVPSAAIDPIVALG
jgi:hypothetical protein